MTEPPTIDAAAQALAAGQVTSRQLLEGCLRRADEHDDRLASFVQRCDEAAYAAADAADELFARGVRLGPLQGIPVGIKDNVATAELPTTGQTKALPEKWAPQGDAMAVELLRGAGAVIVGKTTLMEFAMGMPDGAEPDPIPKNPWDESRWSGGSSSGTANGLAAGFFLGGIGTDTGGSIRLPSAFCGVTGLKPTFDLVSTSGTIPLARSLDHVGPMATTARDCAHLLTAMTGGASPPFEPRDDLTGVRIAVDRDTIVGVDEGAAAAFDAALDVLRSLGATLADVRLPGYAELAAASRVILLVEAFELHRDNLRRRWLDYGVHTRGRLLHGAFFSRADDDRARRVIELARVAVDDLFSRHDAFVGLTAGAGPEPLEGIGLAGHLATAGLTFTRVWNPIGVPALSVPIGFTSDRLPVGMQLVGPRDRDLPLLRIADAYQQATPWHRLRPQPEGG